MTPLTLCADDLGQSEAISDAIVDLARRGRINAASLMVDGPEARDAATAVQGLPDCALGLHITLSDGFPVQPSPLAPAGRLPHVDRLTARAYAGRLPLAAIAAEIERQYDRFEDLAGRTPAFVDGHQHVHMLPGIRSVFLAIASRRAAGAWIRSCEDSISAIWQRGVFRWRAMRSAFLSRGLRADAEAAGLRANHGFAGLYDFSGQADYGRLFAAWLSVAGDRHLIICHPALDDRSDPLGPARANEYRFLLSSDAREAMQLADMEFAGL